MPPGIMSSAASSSSCATLASCALIPIRMQNAVANDSLFILHRTQWQCLAKSYSEVLETLTHLLLQHACLSTALLGSAKHPIVGLLKVALLSAMEDGERCMEDCTARGSSFSHSWLLDKALKLGGSTDVVDKHLSNFLWAFSALLNQGRPPIGTLESDLVQLTRALSDIWACQDSEADLSEACSFLNTGKLEYKLEGKTCLLADFILHRVSHAQDLKSVECVDGVPTYLWIDPGSLIKEPEILGEGAYGKVQEAQWLGGRFAVKDFFYVENNIAFGSEAAIQARLRHPNAVSLICCTRNPSLHKCSLVLELMHQDLRVFMIERMEAGMDPPFSLGVAMDLMLQIAQGMEYLHSLHIMHRDLKSSNVLVSFPRSNYDAVDMDKRACPCAHLKIADFGMSKAKFNSSKYTTRPVGATAWRAPEVFEINPEDEVEGDMNAKYTKKADVYSFGLVCYEILTGKCPFEGTQVRRRVMGGERPLLPAFCPPALSSYIERCWHAEPSRRPPFIQICKMLRFLKGCMYRMNDYDQQSPAAHHGWLLHPLSLDVCARIDKMSISLVQSMAAPPDPQPVTIPLEMHCCRVVLEECDDSENTSKEHANNVTGITITQEGVESNLSTHELQQSGLGYGKSNSETKSYLIYVPRFVKKLFGTRSAQLAKSELQDALGLVRDFTYVELRLATADFSKVVGEGGRGKVYHGKLHDGRAIAVKVFIRPQILRSGHLVSSSETGGFVQELRIASQLRHRNIVTLLGWCQDRGKLLLVYEFMPKGSVARHIFGEQNSLNWQRRYKVIYQLASALKYLHQDAGRSHIVHRDVKAANVLLDSGWNACLGDCGLAVLLRNGDASVQSLAGTFGYIAPECVAQGLVSPALDVYAFGVTVLEIVTGRRAYTSDEMGETQFVRDWVLELYQCGDPMEAADARLGGKFEELEMRRLLRLGLSCTSAEPQMRPDIEKVLKILSEQPRPGAETLNLGTSSMVDSTACTSTSTGSFWSPPMTEHLSFDGKEESGPFTPRIENDLLPFTPRIENNEVPLPRFPTVQAFTFKELKLATGRFQHNNILGEGAFGIVYKGVIRAKSNSRITVAVKVLNEEGLQGHREWLTEMHFLGTLDHPHLIKLIGYCCENTHRLLVYEYMSNNSLDVCLFRTTKPTLQWARRMKIALGAAKGLAFLHGAEEPIIYRDLKTANILLDSDYTAKLSDLGLVKYGPMGDRTHVSTRVMGTYGYAAPEYIVTGHLTRRSDVYGFGVVLLELLTGQRCMDRTRGTGKENLVEWARTYLQHKQEVSKVIDPRLEGRYSVKGAQKAATLAFHCLNSHPKARPTMSSAVQTLESLQE